MAILFNSLDDLPATCRGGALAIGNFDGVHLGHAKLIQELVAQAKRVSGPAVVLTFDPPPAAVLFPDRPLSAPLTSIQRRAELLGQLGVDAMVAYPTDLALLSLTPDDFFQQKIIELLGAKAIVEGPNFRFGKDRAGDVRLLEDLCERADILLSVVQAQEAAGEMVSSTRIREALSHGQVENVHSMLTEPYSLDGIVGEGEKRGRKLGFPTANLEQLSSLTPATGVYAARVQVEGDLLPAAVNVGPNPTFGNSQNKVEIHLIDWEGTLYGATLRCFFLQRIRNVQKFADVAALQEQLARDIETCRSISASLS